MTHTNNSAVNRSQLKQILLAKRLRDGSKNIAKTEVKTAQGFNTIEPNPEQLNEPFPLTEVQQAYWIGRSETFELGNVPAHIYLEIETKSWDLDKFTQAWQQLIDRHDMLRAIFLPDGQQQILENVPPYQINTLDLRGKSPEIVKSQLQKVREHLSHQMLPCDRWPLFDIRASLLDRKSARLHFSFDLLICDAQSFQVLFGELAQLYQNPQTSLPPLELSFRDYVLALNTFKESEIYQKSINYWQKNLNTLPPAPELPLRTHLASIKEPHFVHRTGRLEANLWQKLKTKAHQAGLTPSGILLATYAEILSAWSKSPHFTINLTLFNRLPLHPQVNEIMGDFTSVNLLAVDNSQQDPFVVRANRIQQQLWEDLDRRYVGGITVLRELTRLQGRASTATMPVVFTSTVDLNSQNDTLTTDLGEMTYVTTQTPQVWLDHQVQQQAGALLYHWDAIEELFPENMLDDMFDAYCCLLKRLATEDKIWQESTLDLLPPIQKVQQANFNATDTEIPAGLLHSQFETQVKIQPDRLAVITPELTLTYKQLSCRSNQVAHRLRVLGTRPKQLVAIVMEKGWEQVVAALGILTAGAAYLPIDPNLPQKRLWYLLERGEVKFVLSQWKFHQTLQFPENIQCVYVDSEEITTENDQPLNPIQTPEDLAYVIYTSGSTGLPKGVAIDHRGAINTITDINQRFCIGYSDRVFALSSLSFDLSVYDIFGTLNAGGAIVIPEAAGTKDPAHWLDMLDEHQVTVWNSVPALMQMLVDYTNGDSNLLPNSLKLILLSGDWLPLTLPKQIKTLLPEVQLISLGGATEASIWSILYPVETVNSAWKSIPYGRPMANQRFYVLDGTLNSCPTWVPGHLYIGGIGLAQCYWRDPQKTAASFITHPETGKRLYRTGDLGRYLPDGNIEFLGREDFQVKVQGYRIELGEIEEILKKHPNVKTGVVNAVGDKQNKRLVAYVVPQQNLELKNLEPQNLESQNLDSQTEFKQPELSFNQPLLQVLGEIGQTPEVQLVNLENLANIAQYIDRLSTAYIYSSFKELGIFNVPQENHTLNSLIHKLNILPRYQNLLGQWLRILEEDSIIQFQEDGTFTEIKPLPANLVEELWKEITNINSGDESTKNLLQYIKNSGDNLTSMLRGGVDPLELLFPNGSWEVAENLYQFNPVSTYINKIAREALKKVIELKSVHRPLRILELGAGTGGTTNFLLPILPPKETHYTYTDISSFFINQAQKKFKDYPFIEYKLLDINRPFEEQGYELHNFDVVVAANVLHDAQQLGETLEDIKSLLAPQGLLLLIEATRYLPVNAISIGFLEGLSHFKDERLLENNPFLSVDKWQNILQTTGFSNFVAFPQNNSATEVFSQNVILAQAPSFVSSLNKNSLLSFLRDNLPEYMVPANVITLESIPLTSNGKVDRKSLPQPLQNLSNDEKTHIPPRNKVEQMLAEIWTQVLNIERVGIYDNFFTLGGDSLLGIQIISQAKQVGIQLQPRQIFQYPTIAELAELNDRVSDTASASNYLVKIKPQGSNKPLFCIHSSSGSADSFTLLAKHLDPEQPLYGLQSKGLDGLSQPLTKIEDMAEQYIQAIRTIQPFGPYNLCGWSMGGIVAYEMAQQLEKNGEQVEILALLDISADKCYERLIALSKKAEELGLLPEQLSESHTDTLFNVNQANLQAMLNYSIKTYSGKINIFKACEQPKEISLDPDFGWSVYARKGIEIEEIVGNHFSILNKPHVQVLAEKLTNLLTKSLPV